MPTRLEQLDRAARGPLAASGRGGRSSPSVELPPDRQHRVERRSSGPGRPSRSSRPRTRGASRSDESASRSPPVEQTRPAGRPGAGGGSSRMIASAVTLLPQPLSPTSPSASPGCERERDAVDRARATPARCGTRPAGLDLEQAHRSLMRGSSASRSPSPMKLKPDTVSTIAAPGRRQPAGSGQTYCCAPSSMLPQEGVGGWMPRPRKLSAASVRIALATPSVAATMIAGSAVGQDVAQDDRRVARADRRAPSTNSAPSSAGPRRGRAARRHPAGQPDHDHDASHRPAKTRQDGQHEEEGGRESIASVTRIRTASTQPP